MFKSLRRQLNVLGLVLGGSIFLYQVVVAYQTVREQSLLRLASPFLLLAAGGLAVLVIGLQMAAWSRLMHGLGTQLPWLQICKGYSLSFLPRYIPGSVWGYLSRNEWLRRNYGVADGVSNLGSFLEMSSILLASILIIGAYSVFNSTGLVKSVLTVCLLVCPLGLWLAIKNIPRAFFDWGPLVKYSVHFQKAKISLLNWYRILAIYFLFWLFHGGIVFFVIEALGFQAEGIVTLSAMFSIAWLIGFFSILVPSGLGVREIVLANLLVKSIGLLPGQASAAALLSRMIALLGELIWLLIGVLIQLSRPQPQVTLISKDNP